MYNGNYSVVSGNGYSGQTFTQTVNLTAYDDYNDGTENWQYQAYKHYIRLDFGRVNTSDEIVNVNISHVHSMSHYESKDSSFHYAYCECGYREEDYHSMIPGSKPSWGACRYCGYIRDNNPGVVIKGEKEYPESECK